jgi:amidase
MAENGPLATTVADCALLLSVMADRPDLAEVAEPGALRVAVSSRNPIGGFPVASDWRRAARATAGALRIAGHTIRQANPPYGQRIASSALARWLAGAELDSRLLADRSVVATRTRRHAAFGHAVLRAGFPKESGRTAWQAKAEAFFADHDVLVTPALAQSPPRAVAWAERGLVANLLANTRYAPFAAPWNLAGWPAMAVPAGCDATGQPLSVQLVARPGGEALLLSVAAQLERVRPWPRTAPVTALSAAR